MAIKILTKKDASALPKTYKDISGKRFGKLVAIQPAPNDPRRKKQHTMFWKCVCDCSDVGPWRSIVYVPIGRLTSGNTQSCGCLNIEANIELNKKRLVNLSGRRFGMLLVLYQNGYKYSKKRRYPLWHCKCDCGNECDVTARHLQQHQTTSCGCLGLKVKRENGKRNVKDISGIKFGRLTALWRVSDGYWHCRCNCGNEKDIYITSLTSGLTTSCGCYAIELLTHRNKITKHIPNYRDITGLKFGRLTALYRLPNVKKENSQRSRTIWRCLCDCGNTYDVSLDNLVGKFTFSCGCMKSRGEMKIAKILNSNQIKYSREYCFNGLIGPKGSLLRFDFAIYNKFGELSYLIEYDGKQHYEASGKGWNTEENLRTTQERDNIKNNYCATHNIPLIRFPYTQYENMSIGDLLLEATAYRVA